MQLYGTRFIVPIVLDEYLLTFYLYLHRLSLAETFDGSRHGESVEAGIYRQMVEVVHNEIDGVPRIHVAQGCESR